MSVAQRRAVVLSRAHLVLVRCAVRRAAERCETRTRDTRVAGASGSGRAQVNMNRLAQRLGLVFGVVCFLTVFSVGLGLPAGPGADQRSRGEGLGPRLQTVSLVNLTRSLLGADLVRDVLLLDLQGSGLDKDTEFYLTASSAECESPRQQDDSVVRDTATAAATGPGTSAGTRTLRWLDVTHNLTTTRFFVCASQVVNGSGSGSASTSGSERTSHSEIKWIHQGTSVVLHLPSGESVKTAMQDLVASGGLLFNNGTR